MGVITGDTFNPIKAFCSVRLQQGVPLVDADMNELDDIRKFEVRAYLKWFVGDGVPDGSDGFRVDAIAAPGVADDFIIRAGVTTATSGETNLDTGLYNTGRCLVDGLDVIIVSDTNYKAQPLYSAPGSDGSPQVQPIPPNSNGTLLVYLDVWQRLVTVQEDPALVLPALGTESCVRLKRDWVVRTLMGDASTLPPNGGGHSYYGLATITMNAGAAIVQNSIKDLRRKGLTLTSIEDRVRNLETRLLMPGFAASGAQISPLAAHVGDSIVLNGRNFDVGGLAPSHAPTVVIGGMTATVAAFNYATVTVTVPSLAAGAGYSVSITTAGGGPVQSDDQLTVQPPKGKEGKEKEAKDKEIHKEVIKELDVPQGKVAEKVQIEAQFSGSVDASSAFALSFTDEPHTALDGAGGGRAFIRPEERPPVGRGIFEEPDSNA